MGSDSITFVAVNRFNATRRLLRERVIVMICLTYGVFDHLMVNELLIGRVDSLERYGKMCHRLDFKLLLSLQVRLQEPEGLVEAS